MSENNNINKDAKMLVLDIETKPALVYAWKGFKENIDVIRS